jgi:hypothetical protein
MAQHSFRLLLQKLNDSRIRASVSDLRQEPCSGRWISCKYPRYCAGMIACIHNDPRCIFMLISGCSLLYLQISGRRYSSGSSKLRCFHQLSLLPSNDSRVLVPMIEQQPFLAQAKYNSPSGLWRHRNGHSDAIKRYSSSMASVAYSMQALILHACITG